MGGRDILLRILDPGAEWGVGGQRHAAAALTIPIVQEAG